MAVIRELELNLVGKIVTTPVEQHYFYQEPSDFAIDGSLNPDSYLLARRPGRTVIAPTISDLRTGFLSPGDNFIILETPEDQFEFRVLCHQTLAPFFSATA